METLLDEAHDALTLLRRHLGDSLQGVYLHGSAVSGGLRPSSDVDVLAVVDSEIRSKDRAILAREFMNVSGRHPRAPEGRRPLEVVVFRCDDIRPPHYPARCDFTYGEWLRHSFEHGAVPSAESHPEYTLLLAQARGEAHPLFGPPLASFFPAIRVPDVRRAIADLLPLLLKTIHGDERNVLLTLARMWLTLATGEFVPKDVAADWALPRLTPSVGDLIALARDGYLGRSIDDYSFRQYSVEAAASELSDQIAGLL